MYEEFKLSLSSCFLEKKCEALRILLILSSENGDYAAHVFSYEFVVCNIRSQSNLSEVFSVKRA